MSIKIYFKSAHFIKSALKSKDFPTLRMSSGQLMPEIAVAGRSNVGKSSLLNIIFQRRDLVKTSSTPGKTQMINFFVVDESFAFVDLPGYGYAKVPMAMQKNWGSMIHNYLQNRTALKLILFLFDIRRIPNDEDKMLMEWIACNDKAMILVFTKVDKVSKNECMANSQKILQAFNCQNLYHVFTSATKKIGRKELIMMLQDALNNEEETHA